MNPPYFNDQAATAAATATAAAEKEKYEDIAKQQVLYYFYKYPQLIKKYLMQLNVNNCQAAASAAAAEKAKSEEVAKQQVPHFSTDIQAYLKSI